MNEQLYISIANLTLAITKNIRYINCGGCGNFALLLIEELEKLNIEATPILFDKNARFKKTLIYFNRFFRNYHRLAFRHVMIRVGDYYIDGEVITKKIPSYCSNYESVACSKKELIEIVKHGIWNNMYDANQNVLVQNFIKNHLISE